MIYANHPRPEWMGEGVMDNALRIRRHQSTCGTDQERPFFSEKNFTFHNFSTGRME
jgi:hypothetical protein